MTDPRKAVAQALLRQQQGKPVAPWEQQPEAFRERLLKEADATIAAYEATQWQPIEDVPEEVKRDGTPILGWAEDEEDGWQVMTIHWVEAQNDPASKYVTHNAGWAGRILYPGGSPTGDPDEDYCPPTFTITHFRYITPPEPSDGR